MKKQLLLGLVAATALTATGAVILGTKAAAFKKANADDIRYVTFTKDNFSVTGFYAYTSDNAKVYLQCTSANNAKASAQAGYLIDKKADENNYIMYTSTYGSSFLVSHIVSFKVEYTDYVESTNEGWFGVEFHTTGNYYGVTYTKINTPISGHTYTAADIPNFSETDNYNCLFFQLYGNSEAKVSSITLGYTCAA